MSWLQEMLGKGSLATQNLATSKMDQVLWDETAESSEAITKLIESGSVKVATWPPLLQDVFHAFFKPEPKLRDEGEVEPAHLANRPLLEGLLEDPATEQTRAFSVLDETTSALAALAAGQKLIEVIQADPDLSDAANQFQKALRKAPSPTNGNLDAYNQAARDAAQAFSDALQGAGSSVRKAARQAARAASETAEQAQEALVSWGLDAGQLSRVPLGDRVELAELLVTPRFRRIGELIGRLRNIAQAKQRDKLRRQPDELHSIAQGDNLGRVLPIELSALGHPLRKLDFMRRLTERGLLEYELKPQPKDGKGPIIALIDASGSMSGDRIEWAAACGLALLEIAKRQKRGFAACYFDTQILREFRAPKGEMEAREVMDFATVGPAGGTDFETPLRWALDVQAESEFKNADIVMIGDGECALSDEFRQELLQTKKERGLRIFSILIGGLSEEMVQWSDRVWTIVSPEDEAAAELFAEI